MNELESVHLNRQSQDVLPSLPRICPPPTCPGDLFEVLFDIHEGSMQGTGSEMTREL